MHKISVSCRQTLDSSPQVGFNSCLSQSGSSAVTFVGTSNIWFLPWWRRMKCYILIPASHLFNLPNYSNTPLSPIIPCSGSVTQKGTFNILLCLFLRSWHEENGPQARGRGLQTPGRERRGTPSHRQAASGQAATTTPL